MPTEMEQLVETMQGIGDAVDQFKAENKRSLQAERDARENLERKINLLRVQGTGKIDDGPDPQEEHRRAVKAWYPNRAGDAPSFDYGLYRKSFSKYVRAGLEILDVEERKAMSIGSDPEGGFLAPSEFAREVIRVEADNSVIRSVARVLPMGGYSAEFPASLTLPEVGWVGETEARPATGNPGLGKLSFTAKELYAEPEATQSLIDDAGIDIESFLAEQVGLAFAEEEDAQFIAGNGVKVPRGLTTYTTAATSDAAGRAFGTIEHIATGQAGAWPTTSAMIYDKLVDVVQALRPRYRQRGQWVMGTEAITKLRKMKTATTDEPLWQPSMQSGQPDRLLGYPVREAEQMPAIGANSLSVAFADWQRAYWILDRFGVRVLRDPYTNKPYVRFYSTKRVAGGLADSNAIKLLKFSAS
ncbi:MAG: phage major capsid protein [Steroidobacteraceae bacterium]